jgi:hypothetical protein
MPGSDVSPLIRNIINKNIEFTHEFLIDNIYWFSYLCSRQSPINFDSFSQLVPHGIGFLVDYTLRTDYLAALILLRSLLSAAEIPGNREINSESLAFRHI